MRKKWIFVVALIGCLSAIWAMKKAMTPPPRLPPKVEPADKPFTDGIAATGIIEALGDNFATGSPQNGIVQEIFVNVWQPVKKGEPLFQLDDRELRAELAVAEAKEGVARADYNRIHDQLLRLRSIQDSRAISQEELRSKENQEEVALATLRQMQMEKEKTKTLIDLLVVRAPIDGVVIQKNIKVGEYLVANDTHNPPIVMGDIRQLQVRAHVDEQNASRIMPHTAAIAYPKNQPGYAIPMQFIRIEPYVIPKTSLTGSSKEKVDTRVLQIIYSFEPPQGISLYIGQQVDVYIERGT